MKILPPKVEIGDRDGFKHDLFGLAEFGKGIANLLGNIEDPLVVALNGQWGAGKTVFLKQLAGELRNRGHAVIYFDAFENDYVEDAFAALAREVIELAEESQPAQQNVSDVIKESAVGVAKVICIAGARAITNFIVTTATGGLGNGTNVERLITDIVRRAEDSTENYIQKQLETPKEQKEAIAKFRKDLSQLASRLSLPNEGEPQKPLIFIIDELDRCKPTYALEILERIKHFLSVPNVHFLLGVNLEQLRNSVRAAYGSEIDANLYLQKFLSLTIELKDASNSAKEDKRSLYISHLTKALEFYSHSNSDAEHTVELIANVARAREISLRTIEKVFSIVQMTFALTDERQFRLGPIVGGLCLLKVLEPGLFIRAKRGTLDYHSVERFFGFDLKHDYSSESSMKWASEWWRYLTQEVITEDIAAKGRELHRYGYYESDWTARRRIFQYLVDEVVERVTPFKLQ